MENGKWATTLVELLQLRAEQEPSKLAYRFLVDGETSELLLTYEELDRKARSIAAHMQAKGMRGERAVLLFPPGLAFIEAFFGCLYAGAIAVPAYPPNLNRMQDRIHGIVADARPKMALTTQTSYSKMERRFDRAADLAALDWLLTDTSDDQANAYVPTDVTADDIAMLQYTSGSTSAPKGVILTHDNLMYDLAMIAESFQLTRQSIGVSWLPPYHDMGLIGGILGPIYRGFEMTLMAPVAFIERPMRWLEAVDRFGATHSGAPNFAYDLCLQHSTPEQRAALDLSSWVVAFSGAEPVREKTIHQFADEFTASGFVGSSFLPCYGLAEATLLVTANSPEQHPVLFTISGERLQENLAEETSIEDEHAQVLVGAGVPVMEERVVVVDPTTRERCADGAVGEIWVQGRHVAQGYWYRPEQSEQTFRAHLATGEGPFLRTGDLGFLSGGELFVTGRQKDLIIIRGRNYYPQDIELTVYESHPALQQGAGAAFSIEENGEEHLIIVQELRREVYRQDNSDVAHVIRAAVAANHELRTHGVLLLKPNSIPKTSSGKIQRHKCREEFLSGELQVIVKSFMDDQEQEPVDLSTEAELALTPAEQQVREITALALQIPVRYVAVHQSLLELGMDSLGAVRLQEGLAGAFGVKLSLEDIMDGTVASLVEAIATAGSVQMTPQMERAIWSESLQTPPRAVYQLPATSAQKRMWVQSDLSRHAYNIPVVVRITGSFDNERFKRAMTQVVQRHESLRTTFAIDDSQLMQSISPPADFEFASYDVRDMEREALDKQLAEDAARPFDLSTGPLLRAATFTLSETEHVLLITVHHIAADGRSMIVLGRELSAFYSADAEGQEAKLAALHMPYAELMNQQLALEASAEVQTQLEYWKTKLSGAPDLLELPVDHQRPAVQSFRGAWKEFKLTREQTESLRKFSQKQGATLFMTLMAAYAILLSRYTAQNDLVIGIPSAGRRSETESAVGLFVNTLPVRLDLSNRPRFSELLAHVRQETLASFSHQQVPFDAIVETVAHGRDLSSSPIFQTAFVLQEEVHEIFRLPGVAATVEEINNHTAKFDLSLLLTPAAEGLTGRFEYSTDLFADVTIENMIANFATLLDSIAQHPEEQVHRLELLSPAEKHRVLVEFNDNVKAYPTDLLLHEMFEQQVEQTPEQIALVVGELRLSYRELDARANRLARYLRRQGVRPETVIGLYLERTEQMVISMLAVLKAGGAYLSLDANYPQERTYMALEDAQATFALTQASLRTDLPASEDLRLICVDLEAEAIQAEEESRLENVCTSNHLAYVITTSGSTGRPKPVAIEHRNATALQHWVRDTFTLEQMQGVLFATSICFDLYAVEVYGTLCMGGKLIVANNALDLPHLPARDEVTLIGAVPSVVKELLNAGHIPPSVTTLLTGGETPQKSLMMQLYKQTGIQYIYNFYGPAEDTTVTTAHLLESDEQARILIGRPIPNEQVYLLDEELQPVPIGAPGELYVSGTGLARGYLNRPDLTAERFLQNPFSTNKSARMYKVGDLARFRHDGTLEFIGRADFQVKIRGVRIELGEVEHALLNVPHIVEAAVLVAEVEGDKQLVAFLVATGEEPLNLSVVRQHLARTLPAFMIPTRFQVLDSLPLNNAGKVDRKTLLDWKWEAQAEHTCLIPPQSQTEQLLHRIWRDVLGHDNFGIADNFFDLGGHSLQAMQVLSRLQEEGAAQVPLRTFFANPTIAEFAVWMDEHVPIHGETNNVKAEPQSNGELQLSTSQQRLWFLHQLEPDSVTYNIPAAVQLDGELDVLALERALQRVVRRHETLRTVFQTVNGSPHPVLVDDFTLSLHQVDATSLTVEELEEQITLEAHHLFDLATGPLIRATLLQTSTSQHILLLTLHHIIADGWSLGVLVDELMQMYPLEVTGQPVALPELTAQYRDYAASEAQWLASAEMQKQLTYWESQLGGTSPVLQLPTDRPRPAVRSHRAGTYFATIDARVIEQLQTLSRQADSTLFMALLAGFQSLLYRYSLQEEIRVGSPISGRSQVAWESLIGCFVNTLVYRSDFYEGISFQELLQQVRETTLGAFDHQDLPFDKLVEHLQPERHLNQSPLYQVMFTMQNMPLRKLELPQVTAQVLDLNNRVSKFDLALSVQETEKGLECVYTYDPDLFNEDTIERMARYFDRLLQQVVEDPTRTVAHLSLLDDEDRMKLLGTPLELQAPAVATLHAALERQAEQTPEKIAVTDGQTSLTFGQLNRQANRLARRLQQLCIAIDEPVGLFLNRSTAQLVGMFGIMKSGGAFLPLDPALPAERLADMLQQAGVKVVVTQSERRAAANELGIPLIVLDDFTDSDLSDENLNLPIEAHQLAYVLFTSGSTGKPKGAMIEHRSVLHLGASLQGEIYSQLEGEVKVGINAPFTFDSSVKQWVQVIFGHTICIVPDEARRDPAQWLQYVADHQIRLIDCTPSQFELLLEEGITEAGRTRTVPDVMLLGGEAITPSQWRRLADIDQIEFYNMYGPTECTVNATAHRIAASDEKPTLGYPLPHVRIYVLDEHLEPVPPGVIGEMYIGGGGVSRGYIANEALTCQSFVEDRFAEATGHMMYKTGDLARRSPDGRIEFIGRRDQQVKIRGMRVELDEISGVLESHHTVRNAITLLHQQENLMLLTSYVVAHTDQYPEATELQAYLAARLPNYMVPQQFIVLEQFPMTPNGKVDRKALPVSVTSVEERAPRTPVEELLTDIFATVLQKPSVGVEDDFFALGGHSLLATQVISRIRATFDLELPVRSLFEHPTVSALAAQIEAEFSAGHARHIPPIRAVNRDGREFPLSFAQQRLWFLHQLEPNSPHFNLPMALRFEGTLDFAALERSLLTVVRRHESLHTVFVQRPGEQAVQRLIEVNRIPFAEVDLRELPQEQRERETQQLLTEASRFSFDLSNGPLLRVNVLRQAEEDTVLLLTFHHIISDGWSNGVMLKEWLSLYEAEVAGTELTLPELTIQYPDFAVWQQEWLSGEVLQEQVQYWTERLKGAPPLLEMPTDHPRPPVQTYRGATAQATLPHEFVERMQTLSRQHGTTMYMTLLAAFGTLLYRYTGQDDILIGSPIAGRNRTEIENMIGFFVNTVVMRTDLSDNPTFTQLLGRVREMTLEAYAHQDVPFEKVVEALQPERTLNYNPVYQVAFAYQQDAGSQVQVGGVNVKPYDLNWTTSKVDLSLVMVQQADALTAVIEYSTDLFEAATMERMLGHFVHLLEAVIVDGEQPISRIPLLSAAEREMIFQIGASPQTAPWPNECIHSLFEQHATADPDHLALIFEDQKLTYRELNEQANHLAHHLRLMGAKPHDLIAFCLERSPEMIVAILAILKTGGVYVPLDPEVPAERLATMIEDSQLKWLVTTEKQLAILPTQTAQLILLDRDSEQIEAAPADNLPNTVEPDDPAYMIFTSGSTGKPNGVLVRHRGVPNVTHAAIRDFNIVKDTRVGQFATISFDASVYQIFMAFHAGATLCVVSRRQQLSVEAFAEFVRMSGMEVADLPPVLLDQLLPEEVPTLRTVATGGERCPLKVAERWSKERNFFNVYGPTEATVAAAWYRVPGVDVNTRNIPIGRPVDNTNLYILDAELQPVPLGVPGELYIGGIGLALGYYHRRELTKKRFVPHPFTPEPNARLYKTGDLVRFRADGNIEYLGRTDHQVKVRGFRIELEEIEVLLNHHVDVQEAVVIAKDDQLGNKQLVAYLVFVSNVSTTIEQVRSYLKQKLPHYMVPTAFVLMDELPRLPNRKVNRHVLPNPTAQRMGSDADFVAPRTLDEQLMASIWAELLQVPEEEISLHDSFFERGGHSLLATHLVSRIRQVFAVEMPLMTVFETPTLAGLLQSILASKLSEGHDDLLQDLDGLSEEEIERLLAAELADLD